MAKKSPLQLVKELHGSKDALVAKVAAVVEPLAGESADELAARLKHAANAKLLHLLAIGERVKALGGKAALASKVAELQGHAKDFPYVDKLKTFSFGRLLDMLQAAERRAAGKTVHAKPARQRKR
jgi:hypothetical protein